MGTLNVLNITNGTDTVATGYAINGSAKAWVNLTQVSTQTIGDSLNVSSLTDLGTGQTRISFSSNMSNDDFAGSFYTMASAGENSSNFGNHYAGGFGDKAVASVQAYSHNGSAGVDSGVLDIIIMGELS